MLANQWGIICLMEYICNTCGEKFKSNKGCFSRTPKYCGKLCYSNRVIPKETRAKQSQARTGKIPWNKGVKMWEGKVHPRGTLGMKGMNKGRIVSDETRERLKLSHIGKKYPLSSKEAHWNWKGGITPENEAVRKSAEYKSWRSKVFERDEHTCQVCYKKGGTLHADHILPFATHPDKRFDIENGRTLCLECHQNTDSYGGKMHRKNNRSYTIKRNGEQIDWEASDGRPNN